MNYIYLEKSWRNGAGEVIRVRRLENGERSDLPVEGISVPNGPLWLRVRLHGRRTQFAWSADGETYADIGPEFDLSTLSDEYCKYGEFTGTFVGMACEDLMYHEKAADFGEFRFDMQPTPDSLWFR